MIVLDYTAPLDQIDAHLNEHVSWLDQHYADGTFIASGRREPRTGGVIVARDLLPEQLQDVVADDPFARHGLASHTVIRFHPSKIAEPLTDHEGLFR